MESENWRVKGERSLGVESPLLLPQLALIFPWRFTFSPKSFLFPSMGFLVALKMGYVSLTFARPERRQYLWKRLLPPTHNTIYLKSPQGPHLVISEFRGHTAAVSSLIRKDIAVCTYLAC